MRSLPLVLMLLVSCADADMEARVAALEDDLAEAQADNDALATRLEAAEEAAASNAGEIEAINGAVDLTTLDADVDQLQADAADALSRLTALEEGGLATEVWVTQQAYAKQSDLDDLNSNLGVARTDIAANKLAIGQNADAISDNERDIRNNAGNISANASFISTNTSSISSNATAISTNTSGLATVRSDLSTLEGDVNDVEGDLTSLESDVTDIESDIGCPTDMVDAGSYCIDKDENSSRSWQAHANLCQSEGKRMCSMAEWMGACNDRTALKTSDMLDGSFEYVDEYWVMQNTDGRYYSSYVSVGANACGRVYYSGWACAAGTCYDSSAAGRSYESRCCM